MELVLTLSGRGASIDLFRCSYEGNQQMPLEFKWNGCLMQRGKMPADVVPRGHEELQDILREASGESRVAQSPVPRYSRPTSASSAAGRTIPLRESSGPHVMIR